MLIAVIADDKSHAAFGIAVAASPKNGQKPPHHAQNRLHTPHSLPPPLQRVVAGQPMAKGRRNRAVRKCAALLSQRARLCPQWLWLLLGCALLAPRGLHPPRAGDATCRHKARLPTKALHAGTLDDQALVENDDLVGIDHRRKAMRDHNRRTPARHTVERVLDFLSV